MKFNDMSKEEQREYNAKLLEESDKVLSPGVDWLERHPLTLHHVLKTCKRKISPEDLLDLLWKCGGNPTLAAQTLKVTRGTVLNWVKADGNTETLKEIEEAWLDIAESELHRHMVEHGNLEAVKFKLKTKGKSRGYYEKHEQEINQTIEVKVEASLPEDTDKNRLSQEEYDKKRLHDSGESDEND